MLIIGSTCNRQITFRGEEGDPHHVLTATISASLIEVSRFSSYWKLIRTTAWVLRFVLNVRRRDTSAGELTATDLVAARIYWVRVVQWEMFAPELEALWRNSVLPSSSKIERYNPLLKDGLIHLGGRLQCSDLSREQRHALLLAGSHRFTELLILETHIRLHHFWVRFVLSELRAEFWIVRGQQTIKRALHKCVPCKIFNSPLGQKIEAPLTADRLIPSRPFSITVVDFAGPFYVNVGRETEKAYIALFTCATTGAVHLELCRIWHLPIFS